MSYVGMAVSTSRDASRLLRGGLERIDLIATDVDVADGLADIAAETSGLRMLLRELTEEIGLTADLLDLRATAMELGDTGHPGGVAFFQSELREVRLALEASLGDRIGRAGTADELRRHYEQRALERAGIDPANWDPSRGLDANAHNVELVYEYYGDLYRSDPDALWWAGMAALIGPSFYGGFRDLETFADFFDVVGDVSDKLGRLPGVGNPIEFDAAEWTGDTLEHELRWYQQQLLAMQHEIFFDMAPAHEAYRDGGMAAIEMLYAHDDNGFAAQTIEAWQQIETGRLTGDPALVAEGNATLLLREQRYVIDDDYRLMYNRPVTGEVVTYGMTLIGAPSVPGAKSYAQVFPLPVDVSQYVGTPREVTVIPWVYSQSLPHVGVEGTLTIETPLPDGNIANFEDRWALIEHDTLPTYVDLAQHHQDDVLTTLSTPVGERAEDYTLAARLDDLATWAATGWDVDVDLDPKAGW